MVAGRWTGRSPRWTRCPTWWTPLVIECRCCSTAGFAAAPMCWSPSLWARGPYCSAGPMSGGLGAAGEPGVRQVVEDVIGEFDLTLGLTGHTATGQLSTAALV